MFRSLQLQHVFLLYLGPTGFINTGMHDPSLNGFCPGSFSVRAYREKHHNKSNTGDPRQHLLALEKANIIQMER